MMTRIEMTTTSTTDKIIADISPWEKLDGTDEETVTPELNPDISASVED